MAKIFIKFFAYILAIGCLSLFTIIPVSAKNIIMSSSPLDNVIFTGKVGIGTAAPGSDLEVMGDVSISGTLTADNIVGSSSSTVAAVDVSSGVFGQNTGGGNYSFPNSLSIGTTSTGAYSLLVNGSSMFDQPVNVGTPSVDSHAATKAYVDSVVVTTDSDWIISGNNQYSGVSGNVGIGTSSPSQALDIYGKIAINGKSLIYLPNQTNFEGSLYFSNGGANLTHGSATDGFYNTYLGLDSGIANTGGESNTGLGYKSLSATTDGSGNTAVGESSLASNNGSYNVAFGMGTLENNLSGAMNTAIGTQAAGDNQLGGWNTAVGIYALQAGTASNYNVAVGATAGRYITGANNVAIGSGAADGDKGGAQIYDNVIIGGDAGKILEDGADGNVFIGASAGDTVTTGARNIIIGAFTSTASATVNDWLNIGNTIYGNLSTGSIGIGTNNPSSKLQVAASVAEHNPIFEIYNNGLLRHRVEGKGSQRFYLQDDNGNEAGAIQYSTPLGRPAIVLTTGSSYDQNQFGLVNNVSYFSLSFSSPSFGNSINIRQNGDVGLGTTTPSSRLQISASQSLASSLFSVYNNDKLRTSLTGGGGQTWYMNNDINEVGAVSITTPGGHPGLAIFTGSTYDQERFVMVNVGEYTNLGYKDYNEGRHLVIENVTGDIGINNTDPEAKLDIISGVDYPAIRISDSVTDGSNKYGVMVGASRTNSQNDFVGLALFSSSSENQISLGGGDSNLNVATKISFYTGALNTKTGSQKMMINSVGNVGIGTSSPTAKLHVNGTGYFSDTVVVGEPTAASHAATKNYVDNKVTGLSESYLLTADCVIWVNDGLITQTTCPVAE